MTPCEAGGRGEPRGQDVNPHHSLRASQRPPSFARLPSPAAGARPPAAPTAGGPVPHLHAVLLFCVCVDAVVGLASVPEAVVIGRAVGPFKLAFLRGGRPEARSEPGRRKAIRHLSQLRFTHDILTPTANDAKVLAFESDMPPLWPPLLAAICRWLVALPCRVLFSSSSCKAGVIATTV